MLGFGTISTNSCLDIEEEDGPPRQVVVHSVLLTAVLLGRSSDSTLFLFSQLTRIDDAATLHVESGGEER